MQVIPKKATGRIAKRFRRPNDKRRGYFCFQIEASPVDYSLETHGTIQGEKRWNEALTDSKTVVSNWPGIAGCRKPGHSHVPVSRKDGDRGTTMPMTHVSLSHPLVVGHTGFFHCFAFVQ